MDNFIVFSLNSSDAIEIFKTVITFTFMFSFEHEDEEQRDYVDWRLHPLIVVKTVGQEMDR